MKSWLKKNMLTICNTCVAYTVMYVISSRSFILFGEPEFPTEN